MSKTEFTPGPWVSSAGHIYKTGKDGANIAAVSEPRAETHVGYTPVRLGSKDADEAFANAHLIAAAPELYEALDELTNYSGGASNALEDPYVMERVEAALSKARGESQ